MADVLENAENALTPMMRNLIGMLWDEWKTVEEQIDELTDRLEQIAASDAGCCRIRQIPGIGPIVATAIVAPSVTAQHSARGETSQRGSA
jgi:transposase